MSKPTHCSTPVVREPFERALCKKIIRRQMNRSGNVLLGAMEPLANEDFFDGGLNSVSPAWTLGHLACVTDLFGSWVRGLMPSLSVEVHSVFNSLDIGASTYTKAENVERHPYSKSEIIQFFRTAQVELLATLDAFDEERWDDATPDYVPDSLPSYGTLWESLGVHTYWHLGELCGAHEKFHGTYTLNSVLHYFYVPPHPGLNKPVPAMEDVQPIEERHESAKA